MNLVGPHRDDLELRLGELPVRGYASHGEGWSVALSLRLGSYELLRADALPGGDPVLVLDDVFAELDDDRRAQLALAAGKAEQAIVTAAVPGDVPDQLAGRPLRGGGGDGAPCPLMGGRGQGRGRDGGVAGQGRWTSGPTGTRPDADVDAAHGHTVDPQTAVDNGPQLWTKGP